MSETDELLYPLLEPFNSGHLRVSEIHSIYYEQCGNKDGLPVLFIHGGPGANINPRHRRFFDPEMYHSIHFDQRGCGKSTPSFCLEEIETWELVKDMEKLREHLGISKWVVFGASWGSTLGLLYAETNIDRILALIVSGIFTFRDEEVKWLHQEGASFLFPDAWDKYIAPIPVEERGDLLSAYFKRLTDPGSDGNENEKLICAKAWSQWDMSIMKFKVNQEDVQRDIDETDWPQAYPGIALYCHYLKNKGFLKPNQILDNAGIIQKSGIPVTIIQGRYDCVAPVKTAWELKKCLPSAEFYIVDDAGHSMKEYGTTAKLIQATDKYKSIIKN